jgi:hypothetical protein
MYQKEILMIYMVKMDYQKFKKDLNLKVGIIDQKCRYHYLNFIKVDQ